jgi:hypothetical protein
MPACDDRGNDKLLQVAAPGHDKAASWLVRLG